MAFLGSSFLFEILNNNLMNTYFHFIFFLSFVFVLFFGYELMQFLPHTNFIDVGIFGCATNMSHLKSLDKYPLLNWWKRNLLCRWNWFETEPSNVKTRKFQLRKKGFKINWKLDNENGKIRYYSVPFHGIASYRIECVFYVFYGFVWRVRACVCAWVLFVWEAKWALGPM